MNYLSLLLFVSIVLISCQKDKKEDPDTSSDQPTGFYMKASVNGAIVETADGVDDYTLTDANVFGGINFNYSCSFQDAGNKKPYFQLSLNDVRTQDDNDSDEIQNFIKPGNDTLNDGGSPYYSISYTDANGRFYKVNSEEDSIEILIDEVTDMGMVSIGPRHHNVPHETPRVVKVKGRIPVARLYEYNKQTFTFTGAYIDLMQIEFVIRFRSMENM